MTKLSGTTAWPTSAVRCRHNRTCSTLFACWPSPRRLRRYPGDPLPRPRASPVTRPVTTMWVANQKDLFQTFSWCVWYGWRGHCRRWRPSWGTSWSSTDTPPCRSALLWIHLSERPLNWNCKYANCRWVKLCYIIHIIVIKYITENYLILFVNIGIKFGIKFGVHFMFFHFSVHRLIPKFPYQTNNNKDTIDFKYWNEFRKVILGKKRLNPLSTYSMI